MDDVLFVALILSIIGVAFVLVVMRARRMMPYVYSGAKISAWEAKMFPETRLYEFAEMASVSNILASLDDTDYRQYIADIPRSGDINALEVERALKKALTERHQELLKYIPDDRRTTVEKLVARTDVWNLKTLITAIHNKVPKEKRMDDMVPSPTFSEERLKLLVSAESIEELLEYLKETEYYAPLSEALKSYEEIGLIILLSALDKQYYSELWSQVTRRKARRDVLKRIVGYELDAINIKIILRLKKEGVPPEEIEKRIILPAYETTEKMFKKMITAEDISAAVEVIRQTTYGAPVYWALTEVEKTDSLLPVERVLDEGLLKVCRREAIMNPMDIGAVISHIYLREVEVRNLHAIIKLKGDGIAPEKIKETIVKVPKIEL